MIAWGGCNECLTLRGTRREWAACLLVPVYLNRIPSFWNLIPTEHPACLVPSCLSEPSFERAGVVAGGGKQDEAEETTPEDM